MNPNIQSYTAWCLSPTHHELLSPTTQHHHVPRCAAFLPLDARFRQGHLWRLNCPSHPPQALIKQPPFNYIYFLSSPGPMLQNQCFFPIPSSPSSATGGWSKIWSLTTTRTSRARTRAARTRAMVTRPVVERVQSPSLRDLRVQRLTSPKSGNPKVPLQRRKRYQGLRPLMSQPLQLISPVLPRRAGRVRQKPECKMVTWTMQDVE